MSKLSHKVRHDLRLSVSDRMELADALDAMESALREAVARLDEVSRDEFDDRSVGIFGWSECHRAVADGRAALAKLEGK